MLGLLAAALGVACTVPYLRDTLRRTTVPHRGSWLIGSVLEVVALEAQADRLGEERRQAPP